MSFNVGDIVVEKWRDGNVRPGGLGPEPYPVWRVAAVNGYTVLVSPVAGPQARQTWTTHAGKIRAATDQERARG